MYPLADRSSAAVLGSCIAACVAALPYLQTLWFGFVNYDDPSHVAENPVVQQGLTRSGLAWAFGLGGPVPDAHWFNWPLTWLSHMADVSLFGSRAGGHHLISVALHAVNAALVVAFIRSLGVTAAAAMFCGVVFAVHPVQVESVAWISERKTLVSGCLMLLALLAYVTAGRRLAGSGQPLAAMSPATVLVWTALGALALLGKPMAVVLPVLLLLLDVWPLRRWAAGDVRHNAGLIVEKLPLFALSLAIGLWTIQAQRQAGAVRDLADIPLPARLANAVCATAEYLGMLVWPVNLAVFYPHPGWRPVWQVLLAAAVLATISWASWRRWKDEPAVLVGWLWFVVSLAPMIGVIQVGNQALADRYLYLAMLGPLLALVGSLAASAGPTPSYSAAARREHAAPPQTAAGVAWVWATVAVTVVCLPLTWRQVGVWRDSLTLFSHALDTGHDSAVARNNLGLALTELGRPGDALLHLQRAVALRADDAGAWLNLGNAQTAVGELASAGVAFERCLDLDPDRFKAWNNLGIVLVLGGDPAAAEAAWRQSLAIRPDFPDARLNLAKLLDARAQATPGAAGVDDAAFAREDDPAPP